MSAVGVASGTVIPSAVRDLLLSLVVGKSRFLPPVETTDGMVEATDGMVEATEGMVEATEGMVEATERGR